MLKRYPSQLFENAVEALGSLPGIGRKSAYRLALHLLRQGHEATENFINALREMNDNITYCEKCHTISDTRLCPICADKSRDDRTICVVESVREQLLIEEIGVFRGTYHVLGGLISPVNGIAPSQLQIESLVERVRELIETGEVEVILALSPNVEGETTAFYIYRKFGDLIAKGLKITTLAQGIPVGDELEYADEMTLSKAIKNRQAYGS